MFTEDGGLGVAQTSVDSGCAQRSHRSGGKRETQRHADVSVKDAAALKLVPAEHVAHSKLVEYVVVLPEGVGTKWCVALANKCMYLAIGDGALPEGAQSGFVGILEYAEEVGCTHVVVGVKKSRPDMRVLLKSFMFFGFSPVAPSRQKAICSSNPDYMLLVCAIDVAQLEA